MASRDHDRVFDVRTVRRHIRAGLVTEDEYTGFLDGLPDRADNAQAMQERLGVWLDDEDDDYDEEDEDEDEDDEEDEDEDEDEDDEAEEGDDAIQVSPSVPEVPAPIVIPGGGAAPPVVVPPQVTSTPQPSPIPTDAWPGLGPDDEGEPSV